MTQTKKTYRPDEVAAILGVNVRSIYRLIDESQLKTFISRKRALRIQDELNQVLTDIVSRVIHSYRQAVRNFEMAHGIARTNLPIRLKFDRVITGHMRPPR